MTHWKDYTYHPLHLDPVKIGFKHGQRYPMNPAFGNLQGKRHLGVDYICKVGTPVYAIASGATKTSNGNQSGLMITLTTNQGLSVRIMHLSRVVKGNGIVNRGDLIAYSGNTGTSTAAHSHIDIFEGVPTNINQFSKFIDPLTLKYSTTMPDPEKPQEFNFQGKEFQTRIMENYEILLAYPVLFIAHKYGYKDGEFAWNDKGGFRDFIRWWGQYRSKEQFKQAVEADFKTWQSQQK
jgi:murein DD-endopeptidase MepM/ murein hydrolase activator NlpD